MRELTPTAPILPSVSIGVVLLNLCLVLAILTSYTNVRVTASAGAREKRLTFGFGRPFGVFQGFDGSMTGGLQLIPQWQDYFHEPDGSTLGMHISHDGKPSVIDRKRGHVLF